MLLDAVMDPVAKAIWFIEFHSGDSVDLDAIAQFAGLSRFHLTRAFGQVTGYAYGLKFNSDNDGFEYLAGVAVSSFEGLPREFRTLRIPPQTYAVFIHRGHISTIRETMKAIWNEYLPQSELKVVDAPEYERYGSSFDPRTGNGAVEIFIPIQP